MLRKQQENSTRMQLEYLLTPGETSSVCDFACIPVPYHKELTLTKRGRNCLLKVVQHFPIRLLPRSPRSPLTGQK